MAYFSARDEFPAEYCERAVRECDVYMGIIGFGYGSLVPDRPVPISYTELEFLAATQAGMPRLLFLIDEDSPMPPRLVDTRRDAIDGFRARLQGAGILVKMVTSPDGLEAAVLHALAGLKSERERRTGHVVSRKLPRSLPVIDCDPIRLGVHRAIQVTAASNTGVRGDDLPKFVVRAHDRTLRAEVASALTDSKLVVLVGSSSTGKTRSAVEAIRDLLPDWQLLHPLTAEDLVAVIDEGQVGERTVLWLNESQIYLEGGEGAEAAASIRGLLERTQQILVVGTLWSEYWFSYMRPPAKGIPDPYRQTRQLLEIAVKVDVPDRFDDLDLKTAQALAVKDPRLAVALATQRESGMTQVLAGGPDLIDRWHNASNPYGKAVITAAIDARRLGYLSALPPALLQAAAVAYLNGSQLADAPPDWFTDALDYAREPVKGAISPLAATAHVVGQVDGYLLADYLDQHGRVVRGSVPVPDSVWTVLAAHTHLAIDLNRLGSSAASRGRYRHACDLWLAACEAGDMSMARSLRNQLNRAGHHLEADQVLRRIAAAGDPEARTLLTMLLRRDQRGADMEQLLRHAAAEGRHEAAHDLAVLLYRAGRGGEAEQVLRQAIAAGDQGGWRLLTMLLRRDQRGADMEQLLRHAIAEGRHEAAHDLAVLLYRAGRGGEAEQVLRQAIAAGDQDGWRLLTMLLDRMGQSDRAEDVLWQVAGGNRAALRELSHRLRERRDEENPGKRYSHRDPSTRTDVFPIPIRSRSRKMISRVGRKSRHRGSRIDAYITTAQIGSGESSGAHEPIGDKYSSTARFLTAWKRSYVQREQFLRDQIEAGNNSAVRQLAVLLVQVARTGEGERILRSAIVAGDSHAIALLTLLVLQAGRKYEFSLLEKYGLAHDGSTAHPW
jgi:hypothetical protein